MNHSTDKIASLIGSRICHDLISPIGAVANGLELLELSGAPQSPEMALVAESADHAAARIMMFRMAFGDPADGEGIAGASVGDVLSRAYGAGRVSVDWNANGDYPRAVIRAALLALFCVEATLAGGGRITVREADGNWTVQTESDRLSPDPDLWGVLQGQPAPERVPPASVQFILLPGALAALNRSCDVEITETMARLRF